MGFALVKADQTNNPHISFEDLNNFSLSNFVFGILNSEEEEMWGGQLVKGKTRTNAEEGGKGSIVDLTNALFHKLKGRENGIMD